jgi:hypothetical protein
MTITELFSGLFFTGTSVSNDVPGKFDCALNGHPFMIDDTHDTFKGGIATIPLLRSQADGSDEPGESSTNPEDLWPRSQHSWHKGAGQQWLDLDDGDRFRYWKSRGLDPWTRGQITTLNNTASIYSSANSNLKTITAGDTTYLQDGNALKYCNDISVLSPSFSDAGMPASTLNDICTDGYTVYASVNSAIYKTTKGSGSSSSYNTNIGAPDILGFHKGRLMAAKNNVVYNVTGTGAPTWSFTHPNTDFKWTCFGAGTGCIYMGGYSGDKSVIYFVTVKDDGTGLNVPQVAGELPDGEIVRALTGYLGYLCIGTDNGRRLAEMASNNFLTIGALNPSDNPVLCFEPQDRFVWYGWSNFDESFTGLGRMDLSQLNEANVPAYSSDIMYGSLVTGFGQQGSVTSVVTSHDRRLFTVANKGLIRENLNSVQFGAYVETSEITYGIPDDKVALKLALEHEAFNPGGGGIIRAYASVDGGDYQLIDATSIVTAATEEFSIDELTGSSLRLKFQLIGESAPGTTLNRYTLRSYPVPSRGRTIVVGLLMHDVVIDAGGTEFSMDVRAARAFVEDLLVSGRVVRYQELGTSYSVFIDQLQFERWKRSETNQAWQGVLACKLKVLGG